MAKTSESAQSSKEPGSLSPTDDLQKVFRKFDKNGDGKISFDELKYALSELGSVTSSDEVCRIMNEIDKDGDGYIDYQEFAEFVRSSSSDSGEDTNKDLRDAFDLYDLDRNGLISPSELHMVMKRLGEKCTLSDCCRMIKSVDTDNDGHVNFEEFKKMMTH